jgi:hypothetical protein
MWNWKKINLIKGQKNLKRMRLKIDIRIKTMLWLNDKIQKNNNFYKKIK